MPVLTWTYWTHLTSRAGWRGGERRLTPCHRCCLWPLPTEVHCNLDWVLLCTSFESATVSKQQILTRKRPSKRGVRGVEIRIFTFDHWIQRVDQQSTVAWRWIMWTSYLTQCTLLCCYVDNGNWLDVCLRLCGTWRSRTVMSAVVAWTPMRSMFCLRARSPRRKRPRRHSRKRRLRPTTPSVAYACHRSSQTKHCARCLAFTSSIAPALTSGLRSAKLSAVLT